MKKSILLLSVLAVTSILQANTTITEKSKNNTRKSSSDAITDDSSKEIIKRLQHEMRHK